MTGTPARSSRSATGRTGARPSSRATNSATFSIASRHWFNWSPPRSTKPRSRLDRSHISTGHFPATTKRPRTDRGSSGEKLLPRRRLETSRRPRPRSQRKPRAPAAAPVPRPVVGFSSIWSHPDPHPAADPDPPPGTRDLPGHHPGVDVRPVRASIDRQDSGVQRQVLSDPHLQPDQLGHACSR